VLLNRIAGGGTARGDAELAVDGGQVEVDGARADDELLSHLGVGEPLGHEPKHFDLTGGQVGRIRGRFLCRLCRRGGRPKY